MDQNEEVTREPIFNAPTVVVALISVICLMHLARTLSPNDVSYQFLQYLAFRPGQLTEVGAGLPGGAFVGFTSLLTHAFLHGDWLHLGINCVGLLAFGSVTAKRCGVLGFLALFAVSVIAGGLLYFLFHAHELVALVGASGGVSGLMGAALRLVFSARSPADYWRLGEAPETLQRQPLWLALQDGRVLLAIGAWFAINLLFAFVLDGMFTDDEIAWEAHIGGFLGWFLGAALF